MDGISCKSKKDQLGIEGEWKIDASTEGMEDQNISRTERAKGTVSHDF